MFFDIKRRECTYISALLGATILATTPTYAQSPRQAANAPEEIIVTARKREESILKAPVVMTAFSPKQIENLKITNTYALGAATPGLMITQAFASSGAAVFMRGLGNGVTIAFGDQSVLLNVDGAAQPHGAFYKTGIFDLAQIEIMKGPQALFFGKSASAGIIAITSADPTPTWQAKVTTGYEFNADEIDINGYVAGPITDKFGIRLAGYYNDMKGWARNANTNNPRRLGWEEQGGRLTLKYDDPDTGLRAKFKLAHAHTFTRQLSNANQGICQYGYRQLPGYRPYDDCKANNFVNPSLDGQRYNPNVNWFSVLGNPVPFVTGSPFPIAKGAPYADTKATTAILNLAYDIPGSGLTLTSVSAYSKVVALESFLTATPGGQFELAGRFKDQGYSQELRLDSDWKDSWFNFIGGGLYNPGRQNAEFGGSFPSFTLWNQTIHKYKSETWSAFGQAILTPVEKFEFTAGVRFTDVKKEFTQVLYTIVFLPTTDITSQIPNNYRRFHEKNTSPEFTLSYKPTDDLTAFISYKQGYKGPGSNAALNVFAPYSATGDNIIPFGGEKAKGVEGGVKGKAFDQRVTYSLSGYHFKYTGLQVGFYNPVAQVTKTVNGADAKVQGFEGSITYAPESIEGLQLNAYVNWNNAKYTNFSTAPCWQGQTLAQGCRPSADPFRITEQNLTGKRLHLAPAWTGKLGADYKTAVNDKYDVEFNVGVDFSSSYNVIAEQLPIGRDQGWVTLDAAIHFGPSSGLWEVALIGRNLTDDYHLTAGTGDGLAPGAAPPGTINQQPDASVYVARNRQIMLQFTVRPEL